MKPCPWCGSVSLIVLRENDGSIRVLCEDCGAMGPVATTQDQEAMDRWERRIGEKGKKEAVTVTVALPDPRWKTTIYYREDGSIYEIHDRAFSADFAEVIP